MAGQKAQNKPTWIDGQGWRYPLQSRQTRRMNNHDYHEAGIYLITMSVEGRECVFGEIVGNIRARKDSDDFPHIKPSKLGEQILSTEIKKISKFYPMVEVWRFCLMPDHIHMIIRVKSTLPKGKHLGHAIGAFKGGISRAWWQIVEQQFSLEANASNTGTAQSQQQASFSISAASASSQPLPASAASASSLPFPASAASASSLPFLVSVASASDLRALSHAPLFSPGYNDHILMREGQLNNWKAYLRDNPWRLLAKRQHPEYMQRCLCIEIAGIQFAAFGNFMLLRKPDKQQIFCHRKARYTQLNNEEKQRYGYNKGSYSQNFITTVPYEQTQEYKNESYRWLTMASEGNTVIVTPGISKGELMMKNTCIEENLPLIHIQSEPIGNYWKPEKSRFEACLAGTLLILAPLSQENTTSHHALFHNLNTLAERICALNYTDELKIIA